MSCKSQLRYNDNEFMHERQLVFYAKELALTSKIILDEDFTSIFDAPVIQTPDLKIRNYGPIGNICLSLSTIITLKTFQSPPYLYALSLLPISYQIMKSYGKYKMRKQVLNFTTVLDTQKMLNSKITKHLQARIKSVNDLEFNYDSNFLNEIQEKDRIFAIEAAQTLYKQCQLVQECLMMQIEYAGPYFQNIGAFKMGAIDENSSIEQATDYIENNNELYILLASNVLCSSVFALENALWKSHKDFMKVFKPLVNKFTHAFSRNVKFIDGKFQQIFCKIEKFNFNCKPERHSYVSSKQAIYKDVMDESRNKLRLIFDLTKLIESKNQQIRCASLEEMLHQNELLGGLVRTLIRYETATMNAKPIKSNEDAVKQDVTEKKVKTIRWDDVDEDAGSDDEVFAASPHQSDNEDEKNEASSKAHHGDSDAAIAVQNLMLQELKERMKDVRRIKITKTSDGNLLVQERAMTLEESGGQIGVDAIEKHRQENGIIRKDQEDKANEEHARVFRLPASQETSRPDALMMGLPVMPKSMQDAILSLASQRNQDEDDVFGYVGEEYIDSDEEEDEE